MKINSKLEKILVKEKVKKDKVLKYKAEKKEKSMS